MNAENTSSAPEESSAQYEFNASQNQTIGSLSVRMSLVGFAMIVFGLLQTVNGVSSLILSRSPDRVVAAAEKAGMPAENLEQLKEALAGGFWSSPFTISAMAFTATGLLLLMFGVWTRQAAGGFAAIVGTKGNDISRLMDALGALNMKYGVMYSMILFAALLFLLSLLFSLYLKFTGGV